MGYSTCVYIHADTGVVVGDSTPPPSPRRKLSLPNTPSGKALLMTQLMRSVSYYFSSSC